LSRLHTALRQILLDDPSSIEGLPERDAAKLESLLDANHLGSFLHSLVKKQGREESLSPRRRTAWKNASLLATGRSMAFHAAFQEILSASRERQIPVRPLRETQAAFYLYPSSILRPLAHLEVQVPPSRALELRAALKSRRFFELEDLWDIGSEPQTQHCLPTLERDGVTVKISKRSIQDILEAPWDLFPPFETGPLPFLHDAETLLLLLSHGVAARRFCHSIAQLHDLHWVIQKMSPDWRRLSQLARSAQLSVEVCLPLLVLRKVLGSPVSAEFLQEMEEGMEWSESRKKLLLKCAATAILLYPASVRIAEFLGTQISGLKTAGRLSTAGRLLLR
jgi:hypothetical protein